MNDRRDRWGLPLLLGLAAWMLIVQIVSGGSAQAGVILLAAVAAAAVCAFWIGTWTPRLPAIVVVVVVLGLTLWAWPDIVEARPLGRPLGYANANASLYVLAFSASISLAVSAASARGRLLWSAAATLLFGTVLLSRSIAGTALALGVGVAAAVLGSHGRLAGRLFATCVAAAIVATATLATVASADGAEPRLAASLLSPTRLALWRDAIRLTAERPVTGIGVGRFADASQVARQDPDARYAHHGYLQVTTETGVVGGLLLLATVLWVVLRVAIVDSRAAVVVAAGLAAVGVHAAIDYVLHFPAIPIVAAILAGATIASGRPEPARMARRG